MALYDKASLVLIPSQYKEGKLYNIKPLKDSFEFERGSAATRVNSDGLIEYVGIGEELVTDSGFDDASAWNPQSSWTIQDGKAVYDGVNTHSINQSFDLVANEKYLLSFELSDVGINNAYINVRFLDGGVIYQTNYVYYGDGVHSVVFSPSADTNLMQFYASFNGSSFKLDNVSIKQISNDTPRLDYSGTEPSLLLEPQRSNFITHSEYLESLFLDLLVTSIFVNYGTSPEGVVNSTRLEGVGLTGGQYFKNFGSSLTDGTEYTFSCYYKGTLGEKTAMKAIGVDGSGTIVEKLITFTGNWQRENITFTAGTTSNYVYITDQRVSGTTASNFEVWGAQVEQGSYATSYIPTNGQAETRLADVCEGGGAASVFNDNEGTLYYEFSAFEDTINRTIVFKDENNDNNIFVRIGGNGFLYFFIRVGGTQIVNRNWSGFEQTDNNKIAVKYSSSGYDVYVNGVERLTGTNSISFTNNINEIKMSGFPSNFKMVNYFPEALTDTELQQLTTI